MKNSGELRMNHVRCLAVVAGFLLVAAFVTGCVKKDSAGEIISVDPIIDTSYSGPVYNDTFIEEYSLASDSGASLKGYPKLISMHGVYSGVFNFNNLVRCPLLEHLYIEADTFVNLSTISWLPRLTYLNLTGFCADTGLPGFPALVNLDTLTLYGFRATTGLSALAALPGLGMLRLVAVPATALPVFTAANGSRLRQVDLFTCKHLKDITGLRQCMHMDSLSLRNCAVSDSFIPALPSLRYLTVVACSSVTSLRFLAGMDSLQYLTINGPITDWSPLSNLTRLIDLNLGGCKSLAPISTLINLKRLNLGDWQIGGCPEVSDITCIAALSNISFLSIKNTAVKDFTPLLSIMNAGDTVWVTWGDWPVVDSLLKAANIDAVSGASMPWTP
jgi:hypothetical protein